MEPKYNEAIKAGIIGGVILVVLELISDLISILNIIKPEDITNGTNVNLSGMGWAAIFALCCICLLYIVVLIGTGALSIRFSKGMLRDVSDAVVSSGLAGGVAGLIWGVLAIVLRMLTDLIKPNYVTIGSRLGSSVASGICGVLCCLPAQIVIGIVLAIIGGALYYELAGKK